MSRGSFGRTVARAAASGGSKTYGARRPTAWYLLMTVIVVVGVSLIVFSRHEALRTAPPAPGPTSTSNWFAAYGIDICGTFQPELAADSSQTNVGIRTFGNGLIDIDPEAAGSDASTYEHANATLALFASKYPGLTLSSDAILMPTKGAKQYANGDACTSSKKSLTGKGDVTIRVWSSPTAKTFTDYSNPSDVALRNDQVITIAFVPKGAPIPKPPSVSTLVSQQA